MSGLAVSLKTAERAAADVTAARRVLLLIAGHTGQIGSELLRQLEKRQPELLARGIHLQVAGRVNRSEFWWSGAQDRGEECWARTADDWPQILRHILAGTPVPRLFVDCTAVTDFVGRYPELLQHGIGIVTPNKLANSGSQADYTRLQELVHQHS
ncbi:MAG: hypothetical protein KGI32_00520, partial [Gammaproteobacteria bacterium]|nr:hypothetical protein [Gammaproteobacteria bacterium]